MPFLISLDLLFKIKGRPAKENDCYDSLLRLEEGGYKKAKSEHSVRFELPLTLPSARMTRQGSFGQRLTPF